MVVAANRTNGAVADSTLTDDSFSGNGERNRECEQEPSYIKEIELHLDATVLFGKLQSVDCRIGWQLCANAL